MDQYERNYPDTKFPVWIVVAFIVAGVFFMVNYKNENQKENFEDMYAITDMRTSKCINKKLDFEVEVIVGDLETGIAGRFKPQYNQILLDSTDIDTVAHEVYHMVDTMAERYDLDWHEKAYMQGAFTQCVYIIANPNRISCAI